MAHRMVRRSEAGAAFRPLLRGSQSGALKAALAALDAR
jgi:hypothetical protein